MRTNAVLERAGRTGGGRLSRACPTGGGRKGPVKVNLRLGRSDAVLFFGETFVTPRCGSGEDCRFRAGGRSRWHRCLNLRLAQSDDSADRRGLHHPVGPCSLLLRIRKVRLIVYDDDVALSRIARQYRICLSEVQRAEWRNRSVILSDGCSRMVVRLDWFTVEDQRRFVDYVHTRLRRDLTERLESGSVL